MSWLSEYLVLMGTRGKPLAGLGYNCPLPNPPIPHHITRHITHHHSNLPRLSRGWPYWSPGPSSLLCLSRLATIRRELHYSRAGDGSYGVGDFESLTLFGWVSVYRCHQPPIIALHYQVIVHYTVQYLCWLVENTTRLLAWLNNTGSSCKKNL